MKFCMIKEEDYKEEKKKTTVNAIPKEEKKKIDCNVYLF